MPGIDGRQRTGFKSRAIKLIILGALFSTALLSLCLESRLELIDYGLLIIPFLIGAASASLVFMYRLSNTTETLKQQKQYSEDLFNTAPEPFLVINQNGKVERANLAATRLFGYSNSEFTGLTAEDLMPAAYRNRHKALRNSAFSSLQARPMENSGTLFIETRNKTVIPVEISISFTRHKGDYQAIATIRDIGERIKTEASLRLSRMIFENTNQPILITDWDLKITDMNDAFCLLTGYQRSEVMHMKPNMLQSGKHNKDFYQNLWRSLEEHDHWKGEIWNKSKHGQLFPSLMTINCIRDNKGDITNYVAIYSDITAIKQQEALLLQLANNDQLTKLPNRLLFHDRLLSALARAKRHKKKFAVLYIDLDGFKAINDTLGHARGDEVLIETASSLLSSIREQDTAARLGGDEFAVIIDGMDDTADAIQITKRIVAILARDIRKHEQIFPISASIGVAFYPEDGETDETLTAHADEAMYVAKHGGKNQYRLYRDII